MNSRRRADLQRKLSMGAVPRPPDDLLARIKADIPEHLEARTAPPGRFASTPLFLRVAASLILLVTTGVVSWRVMQTSDGPVPMVRDARYFPPVESAQQDARLEQRSVATGAATQATEEVHLEITETIPEPEALVAERARPIVRTSPAANRGEETARETVAIQDADRATNDAVTLRGSTASATVGATTDLAASEPPPSRFADDSTARKAASAPPPPPPRPTAPPLAAPAPPPSAGVLTESISVTAAAPVVAPPPAIASTFATDRPAARREAPPVTNTLFGISVDRNAFAVAREAVERGEPLQRSAIDVEAIVNYFAGDAPKPPRSGARLEFELSPAPLAVPGDRAYLRLSIDTPDASRNATASVARDVSVTVDFNDAIVTSWRQVGGDGSISSERQLAYNVAVTTLYQLELRTPLDASARIATVELRYTRPDGRQQRSSQTIHARDLVTQWTNASRRHRLATLGALWGEGLAGNAQAVELAKKAKELAEQSPRDTRARELANAASATAGTGRY